ncbi:MAG: carboxypeptidase-like regulatory domain-containing protein [Sandaracinaceae bacterium]
MKPFLRSLFVVALAFPLASACTVDNRLGRDAGGGGGTDGGMGMADTGVPPGPAIDYARVTGTVWAPGNGPGQVPAGHEIPVFDALVRVTPTRPQPIPDTVYCEQCVETTGPNARTSHDGTFEVGSIVPGTYWVTIEKGQFQVTRQVTFADGEVTNLTPDMTTLPSVHDPANGLTIPSIAIAAGAHDHLEDVIGKMGIGGVDTSYEWNQTNDGRVHVYDNGGRSYTDQGSLESLVRDLNRMMQYHIIFIPCAGSSNTSALQDQAVLQNLRAYVAAGGKLYVTDWSGEWMDNVFPAHVDLGPGEDTPGTAYDPETNTWNTSQFGDANGSLYNSDDAEVVDDDLHTWLSGQMGPTPDDGPIQTYNPDLFEVVDNWNYIANVNRVQVGFDDEGLPVTDEPVAYVIGSGASEPGKHPLTVTFEPAGCGRVMYSTYHTTPNEHEGLVPQERILLYLIMEIGVCKTGPILI